MSLLFNLHLLYQDMLTDGGSAQEAKFIDIVSYTVWRQCFDDHSSSDALRSFYFLWRHVPSVPSSGIVSGSVARWWWGQCPPGRAESCMATQHVLRCPHCAPCYCRTKGIYKTFLLKAGKLRPFLSFSLRHIYTKQPWHSIPDSPSYLHTAHSTWSSQRFCMWPRCCSLLLFWQLRLRTRAPNWESEAVRVIIICLSLWTDPSSQEIDVESSWV